ncbi:hypothetical protein D3C78_1668810 [compost metagenome]
MAGVLIEHFLAPASGCLHPSDAEVIANQVVAKTPGRLVLGRQRDARDIFVRAPQGHKEARQRGPIRAGERLQQHFDGGALALDRQQGLVRIVLDPGQYVISATEQRITERDLVPRG